MGTPEDVAAEKYFTPPEAEDICLECGHRRGLHDGAGCTASLPNGDPCLCRTCVDMPSCKPYELLLGEPEA